MGSCCTAAKKDETDVVTSDQQRNTNPYVPEPVSTGGRVHQQQQQQQQTNPCVPEPVSTGPVQQMQQQQQQRQQHKRPPSQPSVSHHEIQQSIDAGKKVVCGLYDYKPATADGSDGDLQFWKGDHLVIIKEDGDWWYAENMVSHKRGYIPITYIAEVNSIRQFEWFHGKIARKDAEKMLSNDLNPRGMFLIRESETLTNSYSLSILDIDSRTGDRTVKHYRIKDLDQGRGCFITPRKRCRNHEDLVQQYSEDADGLCHLLTLACPRIKPVMYDMSHATRDKWEISKDSLELQHMLGQGNFGEVWRGVWNRLIPVAVKTLKLGTMKPSQFLEEASIMKRLRHVKLVALYAVCSQEEPFYIVTELMAGGSLHVMLKNDQGQTLQWNHLVDIAAQVADGMQYLEQQHLMHRDLAARNILVSEGHTVKIGDFGMAKEYFESEQNRAKMAAGEKFPIKWTAPEAIRQGKFSIKSDVWAYGILLIELVTYGDTPYPNMTNRQALDFVEQGHRHPQPENCPEEMYDIMLTCWKKLPDDRPTFEFLFGTMDDYNVAIASSYAQT